MRRTIFVNVGTWLYLRNGMKARWLEYMAGMSSAVSLKCDDEIAA